MPTSSDASTSRKADLYEENCVSPAVAEILRQKTPGERLDIAFKLWTSARELCHDSVSQQHPDWSEREVNREVARRMSHGRV